MTNPSLYEEEALLRRVHDMNDDNDESLNTTTSLLGDKNEHYGSLTDGSVWNSDIDFDHDAEIEKLISEGRPAWNPEEEDVIRRKLDYRVMIWACTMFFSLQLVRNNIQNAISADFLIDANIPQNTYNLGQTLFLLFFLLCEIPSQTFVRRFGAEIWLPILMTLWAIVSMFQIFVKESSFFLFTRAIIGACEGGFVPGLTFYLSSFYKANELSMRYSWIWATQSGTNVIGALLASGFIQMGGPLRGWQWLFLLEGALTTVIGLSSFFVMPSLRRKVVSRVFTARETAILKARVIQDDPSKRSQQERVKLGSSSLLKSVTAVIETLTDRFLFPIFILGFVAFVPSQTANYYLTITLRQLGFTEIVTNLLTIPYAIINISMTIGFSRLSDKFGVKWVFCLLSAIWVFTPQLLLEIIPDGSSRWLRFALITLILGYPYYHPILISWISSNANNPDRRSLAFAVYNISVQCGNILAANVYRESDAPYYHRGNGILIGLNVLSMVIILAIRQYYVIENRLKERLWGQLDDEEKDEYVKVSKGLGNRQLFFKLKV
ncbi:major facilitator superfamily domain-containing protein [Lipomyces tetrasporus]|uniref:Major facilitator superfamily domain-containing protein n=1 Tax=Lipomyces tetrasporus TaxID=54092 RepID=A0AAD7QNH2_9ASCO|nr:major facilitator superfamily domain-containing protein [Lipomyces tetrasporus]KAJ8098429.1 major facilitator superfamily domain-containing protein [Lipomyces tetrasporus]